MNDYIQVINNKKPSLYKNNLTGANSDYLSFPAPITLLAGDSITFDFELPDHSIQRFLGSMDDASSYIVLQTNGSVFIQLLVGGLSLPIGETIIGLNTFKLRESAGTYYASANGGTEASLVSASSFVMEQIARRLGVQRDLTIRNFRLNVEVFLPTGNGLTYKGSLGTAATINTSHGDGLNYVNQDIINAI